MERRFVLPSAIVYSVMLLFPGIVQLWWLSKICATYKLLREQSEIVQMKAKLTLRPRTFDQFVE